MPTLPPMTSTFDVPANRVWEILGPQFGHIGEWASAITHSASDPELDTCSTTGAGRTCRSGVPGVGQVHEQLTAYDPDAMTLTYVATTGMPRFVKRATNTWTVTSAGPERCSVTIAPQLETSGVISKAFMAMFAWNLTRVGRRTLDDLRHYAEHDEPSPRKRRRLARTRTPAKTEP